MKRLCAIVALVLGLGAAVSSADPSGSADHVLIARFPGSEILRYERRAPSDHALLTHPLEDAASGSSEPMQTFTPLRGDVMRIGYASPSGARLKEVYRHYEAALQSAGFEVLYNCAGESCSPNSAGADFNARLTPPDLGSEMQGKQKGQRYLAAKRPGSGSDLWASLYCVRQEPLGADDGNRVYTSLVLVEAVSAR